MKLKRYKSKVYEIQENGLISVPELGEGRFIPALVVNSKTDKTLKELIKIHQETEPGDAVSYWSKPINQFFKTKLWHLHIEFSQPMSYNFQIGFDFRRDYPLIDAIILSQALLLSVGNKGNKVFEMKNEMILLEVPEMGEIKKIWNNTLNEILKNKFKKLGIPKKRIKDEIRIHKSEMRKILLLKK